MMTEEDIELFHIKLNGIEQQLEEILEILEILKEKEGCKHV